MNERRAQQAKYYTKLSSLMELTQLGPGEHLMPGHSFAFPSGTPGVIYAAVFGHYDARVELFTKVPALRGKFLELRYESRSIMREAKQSGSELIWDVPEDRQSSRIKIERPAALEDSERELDGLRRWQVYWLLRFYQAFEGRLR